MIRTERLTLRPFEAADVEDKVAGRLGARVPQVDSTSTKTTKLDEELLASWIRQASKLPGEPLF